MVKMIGLANRRPRQLSGGQQQRVALARALVNRPSVLLLDEPLGALDRKLREDMQIELKLLQTQLKTTFVFVTHDQEEALSMSDRIAVMLNGKIEQLGAPDAIYDEPNSAYVAGFIGQQNFFRGEAHEGGHLVKAADAVVSSTRAVAVMVEGAAGMAAVRPESIEISAEAPESSTNVAEGTLASISHLGDVLQYVVVTASGADIISRRPRVGTTRIDIGRHVWCHWSAADVHVFADDPENQKDRVSGLSLT